MFLPLVALSWLSLTSQENLHQCCVDVTLSKKRDKIIILFPQGIVREECHQLLAFRGNTVRDDRVDAGNQESPGGMLA